jgi:phenylalanine-4-hydroxylase
MISFKNCTVKHGETFLFKPEWGVYDMAVGKKIIAAFSGPADIKSFNLITHKPSSETIKSKQTPERKALESLYAQVRACRENKNNFDQLASIFSEVTSKHPSDWLLSLEILEIIADHDLEHLASLENEILSYLTALKNKKPSVKQLIENGLSLIKKWETI